MVLSGKTQAAGNTGYTTTPTQPMTVTQSAVEVPSSAATGKGDNGVEIEKSPDRQNLVDLTSPELLPATKTWASVVGGNKFAARGKNLSYIPPVIHNGEKISQLDKEEVDKEFAKWSHALILYVVGESLSFGAIDRFMMSVKKFEVKPKAKPATPIPRNQVQKQ
ncbi:hypothetical protein K7X08_021861 [Anisodus acutangulus]|uniref:Uncharacterized protein n=1 Tax=Anisodus acutangulus TaxID=402998 RepID=A0A9Q1L665_9SOLA|nr:hypothetical protein K7X08_021861 [Anisodus acutangulus]